jgi:rhodanese-related sulfurtransferase
VLDASWGEIAPMTLAGGVRVVGELEVIDHLEGGLALIDSRLPAAHSERPIPEGASIPHAEAAERIGELDPRGPAVFFCNGPQCGASPDAIYSPLAKGFPPRESSTTVVVCTTG